MFLDRVVTDTKAELQRQQEVVPLAQLESAIRQQRAPLDLRASLAGRGLRLIAEVKKASPSRGLLCPRFDPSGLALTYAGCGAAAISVLTESRYFQGSLEDLIKVRKAVPGLPILRKDFILEPYQVFEARAYGADALLLIAAILSDTQLRELLTLAHGLGMYCLVETHREAEVARAAAAGAQIIGINNRNLDTLAVDLDVTRQLRPLVAGGRLAVGESGIKTREDIRKMREWGADAVLIGEALVTSPDIPARIKELFDDQD
jgi:indole-3-glycerol phosphate synthase